MHTVSAWKTLALAYDAARSAQLGPGPRRGAVKISLSTEARGAGLLALRAWQGLDKDQKEDAFALAVVPGRRVA